MAVPVAVTATQTSDSVVGGNQVTLNIPASTQVDDLLLIVCGNDDTTTTQQWPDTLSGWSLLVSAGDTVSDAHIGVYYTAATSGIISAGSVTVTGVFSGSAADTWGICFRVTGADHTDPINVLGTPQLSGNSATWDIDPVTTTVNDCLAFYVLAFDGGDGFPFSVSGTGWVEGGEVQAGTGGANASGTWGFKEMPTAGSTGTATVTSSVSDNASRVQFAINPAAESAIEGTVDATQADDTLAASGALPGKVDVTQADDTLAASGTSTPPSQTGTVDVTQADNTLAATAELIFTGTIDVGQGDDTGEATGVVFPVGTIDATQDDDTGEATGHLSYSGLVGLGEENDWLAATGHLSSSGDIDVTQANDTLAASGLFSSPGTIVVTQADNTLAASGHLSSTGEVDATQDDDTLAASGSYTAAGFTGTIDVTADDDTLEASGTTTTVFSGLIDLIQADDTLEASGTSTSLPLSGTSEATWDETVRPDRWTGTRRRSRWSLTQRPAPFDETTRPDRWVGTLRRPPFDEITIPDRWVGTLRRPEFDTTVRPAHFAQTVFVRIGVPVALTNVSLGPYTLNEVPEPLVIRVMRTHRDNSTAPMSLHDQTPAWTAEVYITAPDNSSVVSGRACEILDPETLETEFPDVADGMGNGDQGWIRMAWGAGDLAQVTTGSGYRVQVVLDNGVLLLKSTDVWVPEVNDGPAASAELT